MNRTQTFIAALCLGFVVACSAPPPGCDAGLTACGAQCVDLNRDVGHCGSCAAACGASRSCVQGACYADDCAGLECTAGAVCVSDACVERVCVGQQCGANERCVAGACESQLCGATTCPAGSVCRGEACVDVACGAVVCPSGQQCAQGRCYPRSCTAFDCLTNYACIQEACSELPCVGVICPSGAVCREGACVPTQCGTTQCGPAAACMNDTCLELNCLGVICPAGKECLEGQCSCIPGVTCAVNECGTDGVCGLHASCTDTADAFDCACLPGFAGVATTGGAAAVCTDIDECASSGLCGTNAVCANTPSGSYTCSCAPGFFGASALGAPVVCSAVDRCTAPGQCGANATCNSTPTSYTCACKPGFAGTTATGAPATCTDRDECAVPGACGPYASCTNLSGSFLCACTGGASGQTTDGGPASCAPTYIELGKAQAATPMIAASVSQPVDAGVSVVVVATSAVSFTVADTRANTWTRLASDNGCGTCGTAAIYQSTLSHALQAGDQIWLQASSGVPGGLWAIVAPAYPHLDRVGAGLGAGTTSRPSAVTSAAVTQSSELVLGALAIERQIVLTPDGGAQAAVQYATSSSSGLIGARQATGLSGLADFSAEASAPGRFSGVVATFYGGPRVSPTGLSLSHSPRSRTFTVSWTGGRGNGGPVGCTLRFLNFSGVSTATGSADCDGDAVNRTASLPIAAGWYGGAWSSVTVQLVRNADGAIMGTFPQRLTCTSTSVSSTPTPTVDEDCDGDWDDHTCTSFAWVSSSVYGTNFTACTNSQNTANSMACNALAEGVDRYTDGMSTSGSPTTRWSSDSFGTACQGSFSGAVKWVCTGSGCSYR